MPRIKARLCGRLERERKAAGLTQSDLARLAQVTQGTISKIESHKLLRPGFDVLASLAWALKRCGRRVEAGDLQPKRPRTRAGEGMAIRARPRRGVA